MNMQEVGGGTRVSATSRGNGLGPARSVQPNARGRALSTHGPWAARRDRARQRGVAPLRVTAALPKSEIKNKASSSIIVMKGTDRIGVPARVQTDPELALSAYMQEFPQILGTLKFPLGAQCKQVEADAFDITVPKMEFQNIFIQPISHTTCRVLEGSAVEFFSERAVLVGSPEVENLKLSDRYELFVRVVMTPEAMSIGSSVDVEVKVDLPLPFSLVPKPIIEPVSSGVLQTMSSLFLRAFTEMVTHDYQNWCANPARRNAVSTK